MSLASYYLQKGFKHDYILNLSPVEKLFYSISAENEMERLNKMLR